MGLREKILIGFIAVICVVIFVAGIEYRSLVSVSDNIHVLRSVQNRQVLLFDIQRRVQEYDRHLEQYLAVTGEDVAVSLAYDVHELVAAIEKLDEEASDVQVKQLARSARSDLVVLGIETEKLITIDFGHGASADINEQTLSVFQSLKKTQESIRSLIVESEAQFQREVLFAEDRIRVALQELVLFVVATLVLSVVISYSISNRITRSIKHLMKVSRALAAGSYDARAKIESYDEIGELARTFNNMAGQLARYTHNLEDQVAERSKELAEKIRVINEQLTRMNGINKELEQSGKMLIRRDLELTKANEKLQHLDKLKSEFISVATHQMRTPLSAIKWTLDMLVQGDMGLLTGKQSDFVKKAYESTNRMIALLNDMLVADHIESGERSAERGSVHIQSFITKLIEQIKPVAQKRTIEVVLEGSRDDSPTVCLSESTMGMIFQNILENAIKYSQPQSTVRVRFLQEGADTCTVSIADAGIGIPHEQQRNVFQRFFRAQNAILMETDGSGLGLFIVKRIVEQAGGSIRFESAEGVGTTFFVTLPIANEQHPCNTEQTPNITA